MTEFDPALTAANAKFAVFLAAVLDRANSQQRREFQASLATFAGRLDPEARRTLDAWTASLRRRWTH